MRTAPKHAPWAFEAAASLGRGRDGRTGKDDLDRALDGLRGLMP